MRFSVDSLFKIGSTHAVCQDYTLHGESILPYAVLSDGCSGAPHSDIGARLMCHAAPQVLRLMGEDQLFESNAKDIVLKAQGIASLGQVHMSLPSNALYATFLLAYASENRNAIRIIMAGDGFLMCKKQGGEVSVLHANYDKDYPFYPAYLASMGHLAEYEKITEKAGQSVTHNWILGSAPVGSAQRKENHIFDITIPANEIEWVMLSSDGLETFTGRDDQSLPVGLVEDVIPLITNIKGLQGTFITRRLGKMLKKELSTHEHADDLSVAGISILPY